MGTGAAGPGAVLSVAVHHRFIPGNQGAESAICYLKGPLLTRPYISLSSLSQGAGFGSAASAPTLIHYLPSLLPAASAHSLPLLRCWLGLTLTESFPARSPLVPINEEMGEGSSRTGGIRKRKMMTPGINVSARHNVINYKI